MGRLLDYVNAMEPKSERPPLVVLVADHGEVLGEHQDLPLHYGFGHGDVVYSENASVPLIISRPGLIRPTVVGGVAELVDLAPTLVDYVFDRHDFVCQGKDLRPAIEGREPMDDTGVIQRSARAEGARRYRFEPSYALYRGHDQLRVYANGSTALSNPLVDPKEILDFGPFMPELSADLNARFNTWKTNTPETKPKAPTLTPEETSRLRALGYIQ